MASFKIEWRKSTKKDLQKIPPTEVRRVIEAVDRLSEDPHPAHSTKLSGSERTYRICIGDYRVIYEVFDDKIVIEVLKVGHRKDVYRS